MKNLEEASNKAIEFLEVAGYPKGFCANERRKKEGGSMGYKIRLLKKIEGQDSPSNTR